MMSKETRVTIQELVDTSRDDEVAEWVGLHYARDFNGLSADKRQEFRERFIESHEEFENDEPPSPGI